MIHLIATLDEAKLWLRLEPDDTLEDGLLQGLIAAAEQYLTNATGIQYDSTNALAKLLVRVLVAEWYENRDTVGRSTDRIRLTVESILTQLTYCFPAGDPV